MTFLSPPNRYFAFLLLLLPLFALAQPQPGTDAAAVATAFARHLQQGELEQAHAFFAPEVSEKMTQATLAKVWQDLQKQVGSLKAVGKAEPGAAAQGPGQVVLTPLQFEKGSLDLKLTVNEQSRIIGIFFVPPRPKVPYRQPAYADASKYTERPVQIKVGEYVLPGTLTLPKGRKKVPVVVLVHGSGPQDRDLTVGPNKPFKDLALGLAAHGIATLRYDKRTLVYGSEMAKQMQTLTVQEEVIDDAVAAVQLALQQPEVDPKKVFVLGHSFGGMLAPRIAQRVPELNGIILSAANARPVEDMILDQYTYLLSQGGSQASQQHILNQVRLQVANVKSMTLSAATPADSLPLGLPAAYWLDLRGYNQVYEARQLPQRILLLQGGRDYQVTTHDMELWQRGLKGRNKQYTPILFPELNHLFQEGSGKSAPAEYDQQKNVPEYVIKDIARWVKP